LTTLKASGPGGRITREDVLAAIQQAPRATQAVSQSVEVTAVRRVRLQGVRKAVAERLSFSARTAVPVTITMEADASKLIAVKNRLPYVGFTAFVVKASAKALEKHTAINSTIEEDEVTTHADINIAVAINTEDGLVAPIIPNANKKSLEQISAVIDELSQKAREKQLRVENLTGGTFTVTNLGAYDVESFAPVINPPQCAILGLGRIGYKPSVAGGELSVKPSTLLTLVFDHRVVDGVPAAKFLREVRGHLEDPESLV
jgi:pyruvate dehydrogenase E2 component (dihydrolipoamide acetyltransferase)